MTDVWIEMYWINPALHCLRINLNKVSTYCSAKPCGRWTKSADPKDDTRSPMMNSKLFLSAALITDFMSKSRVSRVCIQVHKVVNRSVTVIYCNLHQYLTHSIVSWFNVKSTTNGCGYFIINIFYTLVDIDTKHGGLSF